MSCFYVMISIILATAVPIACMARCRVGCAARSDGPPLDMGALLSRMMPVVSEVMGNLSAGGAAGPAPGRGITSRTAPSAQAIQPVSLSGANTQSRGVALASASQLQIELQEELGDDATAAEWAAVIQADQEALSAAEAAGGAQELSEAYRAGNAPQGSAGGGGGLLGSLL